MPDQSKTNSLLSKIFTFFDSNKKDITVDTFSEILKKLKTSTKTMSYEEKNILTNFLQFSSKVVKDVMIPRSEIVSINVNTPLNKLSDVVIKHHHTRTIVCNDTIDEVLGLRI